LFWLFPWNELRLVSSFFALFTFLDKFQSTFLQTFPVFDIIMSPFSLGDLSPFFISKGTFLSMFPVQLHFFPPFLIFFLVPLLSIPYKAPLPPWISPKLPPSALFEAPPILFVVSSLCRSFACSSQDLTFPPSFLSLKFHFVPTA